MAPAADAGFGNASSLPSLFASYSSHRAAEAVKIARSREDQIASEHRDAVARDRERRAGEVKTKVLTACMSREAVLAAVARNRAPRLVKAAVDAAVVGVLVGREREVQARRKEEVRLRRMMDSRNEFVAKRKRM